MAGGQRSTAIALRLALATAFLSAVADRFGLWGPAGTPGVAWGNFDSFRAFTGDLLWYLPEGVISAAAWIATAVEVVLAVGLIAGIQLSAVACGSGILLAVFGITMTIALGPEAPLTYSVWTAATAAFLLATLPPSSGESTEWHRRVDADDT